VIDGKTWNKQHEQAYNQLDQELMVAKLEAEKKCQKICAGQTPWSPALTQAIQCVLYWKAVCKKSAHGTISTTVLQCWAKKGLQAYSKSHWQLSLEDLPESDGNL